LTVITYTLLSSLKRLVKWDFYHYKRDHRSRYGLNVQKLTRNQKTPVLLPSLPNSFYKRTKASHQFPPEGEENNVNEKPKRNTADLSI